MSRMQFNLDEIFEVAERIERNGARFYRQAGARLPEGPIRTALESMASMEEEHERQFHEMRRKVVSEQIQQGSLVDDEDTELYLQAMADSFIRQGERDEGERLRLITTADEVLTFAMGMEKDSISFYMTLEKFALPHEGQAQIDRIVQEELKHFAMLSRARAQLRQSEAF